jgi:hypothetical protein
LISVVIFIARDVLYLLCLWHNLEFLNHSSVCLICEVDSSGIALSNSGVISSLLGVMVELLLSIFTLLK